MSERLSVTTHFTAWALLLLPALAIYCECLPDEVYHLGILAYAAICALICIAFIIYFIRDIAGIGLRVALLAVGALISIAVVMHFGWHAYLGEHEELSSSGAIWSRYALIAANLYPLYELWRYMHRGQG